MSLEQYASENPPNAPMTHSAAADLKGQMFSVNRGGWVNLYSGAVASLPSFTVCLRHMSEHQEGQTFFSLSLGSISVASLSLNGSGGHLMLTVGGYFETFQRFFLVSPVNMPWTGLCSTWMSSSGMAQLWMNGMTSVRKGIWRNQVFTGQPVLTIYGLVGQVTDVHVWNYVLSPATIASYSKGSAVAEGTVLSWRKAQYNSGGYVILEPMQFSAGLPCCALPVSPGKGAELGKANQRVVKKIQHENSKRRKVVMGKGTEGPTVL
ncbi:hypothetical protein ANANG_G00057570 [Anguilla anguilla]|uniref:Pentraxin (PTX) domain-containing protein n=1 Tax=Anguilla anguilla TaxID=7936 RepID=A0A9D3MQC3_ANGAN|nr:hypothetical protein ANANG_G00057570 [Anguilla anguilla]